MAARRHRIVRSLAPLIAVWAFVGCSESPEQLAKRRVELLGEVRSDVAQGRAQEAVSKITEAPAGVQADPQVQAALAEARQKVEEAELAERAQKFADLATNDLIPAVEALSAETVEDVEGAVSTIKVLQRASLALMGVEDANLDARGEAALKKLSAVLVARQTALFPLMRKAYAEGMSEELSGRGVSVETGGGRAKTLKVTSPIFASQENVAEVHHLLASQATRFRFSSAEYASARGGEHTQYKVHGKSDREIAY